MWTVHVLYSAPSWPMASFYGPLSYLPDPYLSFLELGLATSFSINPVSWFLLMEGVDALSQLINFKLIV